jgi:hypothetical protein
MPGPILLPNFEVVVGDAFDLSMKGVPFEIQFLAIDLPFNLHVREASNLTPLADETLQVEKRQELA